MMKKIHIMMILSLAALVSACSNGSATARSNTIAEAELTSREEYMLLTTSEHSFVYDFTLDSDHKEASIWVEKYEFGELTEPSVSRMWTEVEGSGFILFSVSDTHVNPNEKSIKMGLFGESGGGAGTSIDNVLAQEWETEMSTWESVVTDKIRFTEDEIILASLSISMGGESMQSLSSEFYEDINGNLHEIENYEAVYIFKAEFTEGDPDYLD